MSRRLRVNTRRAKLVGGGLDDPMALSEQSVKAQKETLPSPLAVFA